MLVLAVEWFSAAAVAIFIESNEKKVIVFRVESQHIRQDRKKAKKKKSTDGHVISEQTRSSHRFRSYWHSSSEAFDTPQYSYLLMISSTLCACFDSVKISC